MADEEPVWEGEGKDPWLPARVDRLLEAGLSERQVREVVWSVLSRWIVRTARRVLRGSRPDPDAIFARIPEWEDAVDTISQRGILPIIQKMYTPLLGDGFPFEARPFVTAHLAEVRNRLVRVPDEVFDIVSGEIARGSNLGESIPDISRRVETVLSTTETPRWENRSTVIARTETIGALNGGRNDAFKTVEDETGEVFEKLWLATIDARTRDDHVAADGQRVPVDQPFSVGGEDLRFPGDPFGSPENVIQCRCTELLVRPDEVQDLSNRQFVNF